MKRFCLIVFAILFTGLNVLAGDLTRVSQSLALPAFGYAVENSHAIGFSNLFSVAPGEAGSSSPAALVGFNKMVAGVRFDYATDVDEFIIGKGEQSYSPVIPASVGFILPFPRGALAVSYHRSYESKISDKFEISTVNQPEGTGEYYTFERSNVIHNFGLGAGYELSEKLSIGARINYNLFEIKEHVWRLNIDESSGAFSAQAGVNFEFDIFEIGVLYNLSSNFEDSWRNDSGLVSVIDTNVVNYTSRSTEYIVHRDDKLFLSFQIKPSESWRMASSFAIRTTNRANDALDGLYETGFHVINTINPMWQWTAGVLVTERELSKEYDSLFEEQDRTILHFGVQYTTGPVGLRLEIADSHFSSSETMQRTWLSLGGDYTF